MSVDSDLRPFRRALMDAVEYLTNHNRLANAAAIVGLVRKLDNIDTTAYGANKTISKMQKEINALKKRISEFEAAATDTKEEPTE